MPTSHPRFYAGVSLKLIDLGHVGPEVTHAIPGTEPGSLEEGQRTAEGHNKAKAAQRWVNAVNQWGQHGRWQYVLVDDPPEAGTDPRYPCRSKLGQPPGYYVIQLGR